MNTSILAQIADERERQASLYEAAAREAVMHKEGTLCVRQRNTCPACTAWSEAVWFHSRGWVCVACETSVRGIEPTPSQRRAGQATDAMVTLLLQGGQL